MGNNAAKKNEELNQLTADEINKFKKMTNFSEKEIRDWHKGFLRDCKGNQLSRKQFIQIFEQFYVEKKRAEVFCNYAFDLVKQHKNGEDVVTINFEEFLYIITPSTQGKLDDRLKLVFDMYNVSGNGLDKNQLAAALLALYDIAQEEDRKGDRGPKTRARQIIKELGKGHNGRLSEEEFVKELKKDKDLMHMLAPYAKKDSTDNTQNSSSRKQDQV